MTALIIGVLPMPVLFMVGFAIALVINYPNLAEQRRRVVNHAGNVLSVVSLIFAAGIFTGILNNTGMVEAMSHSFLAVIPESWGPYLAVITAVASMPFTFFMSNDAFYFGVLPILSEAAGNYGITRWKWRAPRWPASRCTCSARWCRPPTCWWAWPRSNSPTTRSSP